MVATIEKIFSFANTMVSSTETVVSDVKKIFSDVETMVSVKKKVFSAMKRMFSVPSTNRLISFRFVERLWTLIKNGTNSECKGFGYIFS